MNDVFLLQNRWKVQNIVHNCKHKKHKKLIMDSFLLSRITRRTEEQTKLLHINIKKLVELNKKKDCSFSRDTMCLLFLPLIIKITTELYYKYCRKHYLRIMYKDIFQEGFVIFLKLLDKYDNRKSAFPYYIKIMLKFHLKYYVLEVIKYIKMTSTRMVANSLAVDRSCASEHKVVLNVLVSILYQDIIDIIKIIRVSRNRAPRTIKTVCDELLLGPNTIQGVATKLGLTYHSIYQVYQRIQVKVAEMINNNKYATCHVDINIASATVSGSNTYNFTVRNRKFNE